MPKRSEKVAPDLADVRSIAIPRALLWWRRGTLWQTFFEALGRDVRLSAPSSADTLARGDAVSVDECCLASKLYMGHVESLIGKADALFVPCYVNEGRFLGYCTKYQSLPDLVFNTFVDRVPNLRIVSCLINENEYDSSEQDAFERLALRFGASPAEARRAWKAALRAQEALDETVRCEQERAFAASEALPAAERAPRILVAAHPYVAGDALIGGQVVDMLRSFGAEVFFASLVPPKQSRKASFEFSETMPWVVNREIVGAIALLREQMDGVVVISAFPCGPDSMTNEAVARRLKGTPTLTLTVDAQSGSAGLETRVESFMDILRYRQRGGYLHANEE